MFNITPEIEKLHSKKIIFIVQFFQEKMQI